MVQCNCRDKSKCPLQGKCLTPSATSEADVKTSYNGKVYPYIGLTEPPFKTRWYDQHKSFRNPCYRNSTELSKLIWELKEKNIHYTIDWKILTRCPSYKAGSRTCNLCLTEKLHILKTPESINKKTELLSKCRHERKFLIKFCT